MGLSESGCLGRVFVIEPVHDLRYRVSLYNLTFVTETMIQQSKRGEE